MTDPNTAKKMMMYDANKKHMVLAYVLWFFLGAFGAHRMYINRTMSGIIMAILTVISWITLYIIIGGFGLIIVTIWWVIDAFLIMGWVERHNNHLAQTIG